MKRYKLIIIGLFFTLNSCSDFLKEEPLSQMPQDKFFSEPDHAYGAVNALYRKGIADLTSAGSAYIGPRITIGSYMSGFFDNPRYSGQEKIIDQAIRLDLHPQTSADFLDGIWDNCYSAISRANLAIQGIPGTPKLKDLERRQLLAQAYFFRAFNYFSLVKFFGEVPLVLKPVESQADFFVAKSTVKDVYAQIVNDLTYASEQGALTDLPMCKNNFRVSKGSVDALLADVYLTMSGEAVKENKYADAAAVAKRIISSGKYKLIEHPSTTVTAYDIIRTSDVEDEYMYQVEYNASISDHGWMPTYSFPNSASGWGAGIKYSITCEILVPKDNFLAIYDPAEDIRIKEKQYFHSSYTFTKTNSDNTVETVTKTFPTMPYVWFEKEALFNTGKSEQDSKLYRYAEVLLIAAEAIAKTEGNTAEAQGYLAQVRRRASLTGKTIDVIKTELASLSPEQFIEEVWIERLREFSCEFKIWDLMQRTRKIVKADINNKGKFSFVNLVGTNNEWGNTFKERDLLFPISANELQRNPKLTQNPGYN